MASSAMCTNATSFRITVRLILVNFLLLETKCISTYRLVR